jgi:RNA polymerase sigma-70 factor (ECF subfamily)
MSSLSGAHFEADDLPTGSGPGSGPPLREPRDHPEDGGAADAAVAVARPPLPASGPILDDPAGLRDAELLRKAQTGDRAAFGQIVLHFQDRLYNSVLRLVGDPEEARELTQETFTRALVKLDSFRGEAGPYTWLFRIAVNLAISQLRKFNRRRTFSLDAVPRSARDNGRAATRRGGEDQAAGLAERLAGSRVGAPSAESPAEIVEKREQHQQVLAALGRLDAEYRAVLVMRDVEGFDYQQMADVLGLPLGTLKSRLFRARLALRDELKAYLAK